MILYPKAYFEKITDISIEFLKVHKIEGLILDVDNTLIDYNKVMIDGLEKWVQEMKANDIKLFILSNSNKKNKIEKISKDLQIEYIYFAKKPLKMGFKKTKKILGLNNENIGVVGDQIFTDILGANRCKMFSILVKPINEKDILITKLKRPIEKHIIKKFAETEKR